jgi:SNF2 family DNA or RNA helicase
MLGTKEFRRLYDKENPPIYKNYRKLKDFQLESLNWLVSNWHDNRNCILADEMGLGKTIQAIAFLQHLHVQEGVTGPFLVLAPLSTLHQWRREVEEWTNFNCLLYYDEGNSQIREIIRGSEFHFSNISKDCELVPTNLPKFQILLTNYEIFLKDFELLKHIAFQFLVLDEAHRLKNKQSKLTTTLNRLPCYRKLLLTGTPIQNNTRELWTLLNFIEPK